MVIGDKAEDAFRQSMIMHGGSPSAFLVELVVRDAYDTRYPAAALATRGSVRAPPSHTGQSPS
jgi:hypothetical protein